MELLESDDMKSELLRRSAKHREELEEEVKLISARTEQILTNALVIGGSLALTYFLMRQFTGGSKKKRKVKAKKVKLVKQTDPEEVEVVEVEDSSPGIFSQVGTALASQASVLLLTLAKEKLAEYLQSQSEKKAKEHDHS